MRCRLCVCVCVCSHVSVCVYLQYVLSVWVCALYVCVCKFVYISAVNVCPVCVCVYVLYVGMHWDIFQSQNIGVFGCFSISVINVVSKLHRQAPPQSTVLQTRLMLFWTKTKALNSCPVNTHITACVKIPPRSFPCPSCSAKCATAQGSSWNAMFDPVCWWPWSNQLFALFHCKMVGANLPQHHMFCLTRVPSQVYIHLVYVGASNDLSTAYIYSFSRCFYPKWLTEQVRYAVKYVCSLGIDPVLLLARSTRWATRTLWWTQQISLRGALFLWSCNSDVPADAKNTHLKTWSHDPNITL